MTRRLALGVVAVVAVALAALALVVSRGEPRSDPSARPAPGGTLAEESLPEQVARIAAVVEEIRGLEFDEVPEPTTITPDELADRVAEELQDYSPEEAAEDERVLQALGAIDPDDDLRTLIIRGYSEQVGGFYDPSTGELVVGAEDPTRRLGRLEEIILAHELEHALADATLGLPDVDDPEDGEEDRVLARLALTEGDATVTMQQYVEVGFSVVDQLLLPAELVDLEAQLAGFTELPHYIQRSFTFPYEEGAVFVSHLLSEGGWPAVDRAYAEPPLTTAEVLFPARYPAAAPTLPARVGQPGPAWEHVREMGFGAADLLFLLEAPGDDPDAALADALEAAGAWRGGVLHLFVDDERTAVAISVATDGTAVMCRSVQRWYDAAHNDDTRRRSDTRGAAWKGGDWHAVLSCQDDRVDLGIAPTAAVAASLVGDR